MVLWVLLPLLLTTPHEAEPAALTLQVMPTVSMSPANVRVTATVERHEDNRRLTVTANSPSFYRSSSMSLNGAQAARTYTRVFTGLPAGQYVIEATIERSDGQAVHQRIDVVVAGSERDR